MHKIAFKAFPGNTGIQLKLTDESAARKIILQTKQQHKKH